MDTLSFSQQIKNKALELGFDACGISGIEELSKEKSYIETWLSKDFHGDMAYMARNLDKRTDPSKLVEGALSVISVLLNYYPAKQLHPQSYYKISKYALGIDYHYIIKDKLKELMAFIETKKPNTVMRAFTDSAPILDKSWALKSGLGWMGKNTLLLNKKLGSFFFIGEIIVGVNLHNDSPLNASYCGTCTKCVDACPTGALLGNYTMDATQCIAYLNIESKSEIPDDLKPKLNNWIFGCDICQDVCPWNSKATPNTIANFDIRNELALMKKEDWENLQKPQFKRLFKSTPVQRSGYKRLKMVIDICKNNNL